MKSLLRLAPAALVAFALVHSTHALSPESPALRAGAGTVEVLPALGPRALSGLSRLQATGASVSGILWSPEGHARTLRGVLEASAAADADPVARARSFLTGNHELLGLAADARSLDHRATVEHLLGTTVRFQRTAAGLPVVPGEVVVGFSPEGDLAWVTHESSSQAMPDRVTVALDRDDALAVALADLRPRGELRARPETRRVITTVTGKARPAVEVMIPSSDPLGDWVYMIGAGGEVISRRNAMWFARGRVFQPNAVVAARNPGLQDQNDAASAVPAEAYTEVELLGLDGSGYLTGQYVSTADTDNRAHQADGLFLYDRSDRRFEEVMAYHFIDQAQRRFQALGVTNANNRVQVLHAHGTNDDNSWYSPATKKLTFGDGGVDDAEDAEIVWHEYGHSTQDNQVPGWGGGGHARAMGEGFGDFLGAVLSEAHSDFQELCVGDWDAVAYANTSPPCLRRLDSPKHFPEDLQGQEHADGEIWSAVLWQLRQALGDADTSLRLVLGHHFLLPGGSTMPEAAEALLQADEQLYQGAHRSLIKTVMMNRGILEASSYLKVVLTDTQGSPVGGRAILDGGAASFLVPSDTGAATQKVAPGPHTLEVVAFGFVSPPARSFTLEDDATVEQSFVLAAAESGTLTGRVVDSSGTGLAARIVVVGTPLEGTQAGADGTFALTAPVGTYTLQVSAMGYRSQVVEGVSIPGADLVVTLEPVPPYLVVDDDGSKGYEAFFTAALTALGKEHMVKTLAPDASVEAADLLPFEAVIWVVGDRYSGIFPEATQAAVKAYLQAGGRLVLSGQDIGYGLKSTPFYAQVLGAGFVKDTAGSKHVEGAGLSFSLEGGDGAGNQGYPDVVEAKDGATAWLRYGADEVAALIHDWQGGRVVYLGFGLEGVSTATDRAALMGACLQAGGEAEAHRRTLSARWSER